MIGARASYVLGLLSTRPKTEAELMRLVRDAGRMVEEHRDELATGDPGWDAAYDTAEKLAADGEKRVLTILRRLERYGYVTSVADPMGGRTLWARRPEEEWPNV